MVRLVARVTMISTLITVLVMTGSWPAGADGVLGLYGPTGDPLPWTLAAVVLVGAVAFVVRTVIRFWARSDGARPVGRPRVPPGSAGYSRPPGRRP